MHQTAAAPWTVRLEGVALHAGVRTAVSFTRTDGPLTLAQNGRRALLSDLEVTRTDSGVSVEHGCGIRIDLVEHLLAAFAGLGVFDGVVVHVEGPEPPILDGGCLAFVRAIRTLVRHRDGAPRVRVARHATLSCGGAVYSFAPAASTQLRVDVSFPAPVGEDSFTWDGDADSFMRDIAPARTFGWASDHAALLRRGRAMGASLDAVLGFDDSAVMSGCRPPAAHEVAKHKLLDLLGDMMLHGGRPLGYVRAERPVHSATHRIMREAFAERILERVAR